MSRVYKILPQADWEAAVAHGVYEGSELDRKDGFIHLSTGVQAPETARLWFRGQPDLMVLEIEGDDLGAALRWEASRGGDLFPHLYASMDVGLVREARAAPLDGEGVPVLGPLR